MRPDDATIATALARSVAHVFNRHFKVQLSSEDILWRYSGVRPL